MLEFLIGAAGAAGAAWLARHYSVLHQHEHEREMLRLQVQRDIAIADAQARAAAPAPHTLTYSPTYHAGVYHTTYAPEIRYAAAPAALPAATEPASTSSTNAPSFADLLAAGSVGKGEPLLLGYTTDGALTGAWRDLYSCAVAGRSGSGKSTSQRFFACQTALHGAKFVVCDPHADAGAESLAHTLAPLVQAGAALCEPASTPQEILQAVQLVRSIGEARLHGDADRTPVIIWIDETTALLSRSDIGSELASLLTQIAQEFRKVAVFASVSSQLWTGSQLGGTALRDSLASVICHRLPRNQSRLLVPADYAKRTEQLPTGAALLYRTNGTTELVQVPYTSDQDVRAVARLLSADQPTMPRASTGIPRGSVSAPEPATATPDVCLMYATTEQACGAPEPRTASQHALSAEQVRYIELFKAGASVAEIVREVHSVQSNAGKRYQQHAQAVQDTIRSVL